MCVCVCCIMNVSSNGHIVDVFISRSTSMTHVSTIESIVDVFDGQWQANGHH
jgi:hypothetical protein